MTAPVVDGAHDSAPGAARSMVPRFRHLAPQLVFAGVLPVVAYMILRPHLGSDAVALAIVMVFPIIEIGFERFRHRHFEPIGIIALVGIAIGLIGAVALHGDATLLKVRDSLVTGVFGAACLVSLGSRRPAMFYLGRSFATGNEPDKLTEFNKIWDLPGVPGRFRFSTLVWGVVLVAEAILRTGLALTLPTETFLVITSFLSWAVIGGLLWFTARYSRAGEELLLARQTA